MAWWLGADHGPAVDTVAEDLAAFGMREVKLPAWMQEGGDVDQDFAVLPQNWDAVQAFLACSTQWRLDPKGAIVGLRYDALEIVLKRLRIEDPNDAWIRVRVMEQAALKEFAKQRA